MDVNAARQSTDNNRIQSLTEAAAKRLSNGDLPVPPEYDFQADVTADRKLGAVMCAIARIAKQRGTTFTQQVDIWEEGE
jgi:hypothetical protein